VTPLSQVVVACAAMGAGIGSFLMLHRPYVASLCVGIGACWIVAMAVRDRSGPTRLLSRLLLAPSPGRSWRVDRLVMCEGAALMILLGWLAAPSWRNPPPLSPLYDDHESTSLNIAVTRAKCGSVSSLSDSVDVAAHLSSHPADSRTPLAALATFPCSSIHPKVINENSLMLIEAATLWMWPDASLTTVARVLVTIEVLGVGLFLTALTITGVPFLCCALLAIAIMRCIDALMVQYAYSMYPMMVPCALGFIGMITIAPDPQSRRLQTAIAFAVGVALAAIGNVRTDLYAICGVVAGFWMFERSRSRGQLLLQAVGLIAGAVAFTVVWIRPVERVQPQRLTGHTITHPLVLALAIPDHPLARQVGIVWNDDVGLALARRIKPGVEPLSSEYEAVLGRLYVQLWQQHPREMLDLYRHKFFAAARSFVVDTTGIGFDGQLWRSVLRPLGGRDSSGWMVPVLLAAAVLGGLVTIRRFAASWAMPLTLLAIAGSLNWLEAAIIFSHFTVQYFGLAFIALLACCVGLYQFVFQLAWWPMTRSVWPRSS
jgi:hypothetical protein